MGDVQWVGFFGHTPSNNCNIPAIEPNTPIRHHSNLFMRFRE